MFAMLTLVLADNFLLMFVGWEGVGLCSYLLIGYYIDKKEAGDAAKKAFITNRVGDWGFVLGIMLTFFAHRLDQLLRQTGRRCSDADALSFYQDSCRSIRSRWQRSLPVAQRRSRCFCSSAPPERARRFRCTSGCRTRWPARRRSRR